MGVPINTKINTILKLRDVSQTSLAIELGISRSHLNRYLNSEVDLSSQKLASLLEALGFDLNTILDQEISNLLGYKKCNKSLGESLESTIKNLRPISRKAILNQLLSKIEQTKVSILSDDIASIKAEIKSTRTLRGINA